MHLQALIRPPLALLALLLIALGAAAAEPAYYPATLIDADCEDDDASGGTSTVVGNRAVQTQDAGAADGLCDTDNIIKTGAQTSDVTFGPFDVPSGSLGVFIHADADTVTGGSSDWRVCIAEEILHEPGTQQLVVCGAAVTSASDNVYLIGNFGVAATSMMVTGEEITAAFEFPLPKRFYIRLDLVSATSWAGSLSWQFTN